MHFCILVSDCKINRRSSRKKYNVENTEEHEEDNKIILDSPYPSNVKDWLKDNQCQQFVFPVFLYL